MFFYSPKNCTFFKIKHQAKHFVMNITSESCKVLTIAKILKTQIRLSGLLLCHFSYNIRRIIM